MRSLDDLIYFNGSVMTLRDWINKYCTDPEKSDVLVDRLFATGVLRLATDDEIDKITKPGVKNTAKEMPADVLEPAEVCQEQPEKEPTVYEYVEIDVEGKTLAKKIVALATKLGVQAALIKSDADKGIYTLAFVDITVKNLTKIKRHLFVAKTGSFLNDTANSATKGIVETADFASQHLAVPITKAVFNLGIGAAKVVGKFAVAAGSSLVTGAPKAYREGKAELSNDSDVMQAGVELGKLKSYVSSKVNSTGNNQDVRISK